MRHRNLPLVRSVLPNRSPAGFTLLEMIVVLVILSLVAGLVLERGPPKSPVLDLRRAANTVASVLRGARGQAIATDQRVVFRMDVAAREFTAGTAAARALPAALGVSFIAVSGEAAGARVIGISFAPDGSSSGGTIKLMTGTLGLSVVVDWLTGRVTIIDAPVLSR